MAFNNPTASGFVNMQQVLMSVAELNRELKESHGICIHVSGHFWHEIAIDSDTPLVGHSHRFNNPRCVEMKDWIEKAKSGVYAPIGRVIPAGFGIDEADEGAFINPDKEHRLLSHNMLVHAMRVSANVKSEQAGLGDIIYWDGPDGIRWRRLVDGNDIYLNYKSVPKLDEWKLIVSGVGNAIKEARLQGLVNEKVLIEGKPAGDPCYIAVMLDPYLEMQCIGEINEVAGAEVAWWQGEFAHERGAGWKFRKAMELAIKRRKFRGQVHMNAGGLGQMNFTKALKKKPRGTKLSEFQQYVDNDYPTGTGVREWREDQKKTIQLGARWSAETGLPFELEHDARFSREKDTIAALRKSVLWTKRIFDEEAARLTIVSS